VVTLVSCLPVATLGMAAALTHLLRAPAPAEDAGDRTGSGTAASQQVTYGDRRTGPEEAAPARTGSRLAAQQPPAEVDRAEVVAELADQIRDAIDTGERWRPDYEALMRRTGFRRSWCEKAVRDARTAVFRTAVPGPAARTGPDEPARTGRPPLHAVDGAGR
jgi:hypothetical protein